MNNLKTLLALFACAIHLLFGCQKTEACFTIEDENYLNPNYPVQFRNCSVKADEYEWDFGDGETSSLAEPTHIFSSGMYEIKLTATKGDGVDVFMKSLVLDYAHIDKIRFISMRPTKPNGDPWDPDGSGADILLYGRDSNRPPGINLFNTGIIENVTFPYEVAFPYDLYPNKNINFATLLLTVEDINNPFPTDEDTVCQGTISFEDIVNAPIQRFDCDNISFEIYTSHH